MSKTRIEDMNNYNEYKTNDYNNKNNKSNIKRSINSVPTNLSQMKNKEYNQKLIINQQSIPRSVSHGYIDYNRQNIINIISKQPYYGTVGSDSNLKRVIIDSIQLQKKSLNQLKRESHSSHFEETEREQSVQEFQQILDQGYTCNLVIAILQGLIAPFILGYSVACINLPQEIITKAMGLGHRDELFRLITSSVFMGGFVGSALGAKMGDYLGRKKAFILNNFVFIMSSGIAFISGMTFVKNPGVYNPTMFIWFCVSRFILGVGVCIGATITPMYLGEISPPLIRGQVGTLTQLFVSFGILFAAVLGYEHALGSSQLWPYLFLVYGCLPVLQLLTLWSFPESPKWLLQRNKQLRAREVLIRLRQTKKVSVDLLIIKNAIQQASYSRLSSKTHTNGNSFTGNIQEHMQTNQYNSKRSVYIGALIAVVLMLVQQFCGVTLVFMYSTDTLKSAGITDPLMVYIGTIIVYCANSFSVLIAASLIDKLGRKILIYISSFGLILASILISIAQMFHENSVPDSIESQIWGYIVVISMFITVVTFEIGIGPIPWLLSAEISPSSHRGIITGLNTFVNQAGSWFVSFLGPIIVKSNARYFPFVAVLLSGIIFTKLYIPETKGKNENQIQKEMNKIKLC